MNTVETGRKSLYLRERINQMGVEEVIKNFSNLYYINFFCIFLTILVSFQIMPLQQFYLKRELQFLNLYRTFAKTEVIDMIVNIKNFLKILNTNKDYLKHISRWQVQQSSDKNKRKKVSRQFKGTVPRCFNKWIISNFFLLILFLNIFYVTEFFLLFNSKKDILVSFLTT
jgi:hypothetical protein